MFYQGAPILNCMYGDAKKKHIPMAQKSWQSFPFLMNPYPNPYPPKQIVFDHCTPKPGFLYCSHKFDSENLFQFMKVSHNVYFLKIKYKLLIFSIIRLSSTVYLPHDI